LSDRAYDAADLRPCKHPLRCGHPWTGPGGSSDITFNVVWHGQHSADRVEVPLVRIPLASIANSVSGVVNREEPQTRQTKTFGKNKTPGLSIFLKPRKWMFISAANSQWFSELHNRHDTVASSHNLFARLHLISLGHSDFVPFSHRRGPLSSKTENAAQNCNRAKKSWKGYGSAPATGDFQLSRFFCDLRRLYIPGGIEKGGI